MQKGKIPEKLLQVLEKNTAAGTSFVLSIDGPCASGKSTLAKIIEENFCCNVFHMDDFFLRPFQRSRERLLMPGGNVDFERFRDEVLLPVHRGETVIFRPYSCKTQTLGEEITVPFKPFSVVEGVYSMHPALEKYYDFSVFVTADFETRSRRILLRNGEKMLRRFMNEFIPLENLYFEKTRTEQRCRMSAEGFF